MLPSLALRERGHEIVHVAQEYREPIGIAPLADCDFVHIHRPLVLYDDGAAVTRLLEAGVAVGFDEDDNVVEMPLGMEAVTDQPWLPRSRRNFELMLEHVGRVALVTTPSDQLADRFEDAGAGNVQVIDNYLPGAFNRVRPLGHEGLVIGWHAGREHLLDANALDLRATLERVLETHPDVHVVTINIELELAHERYRCEEALPIERLTQRLADFDLGIVPLDDNAFNRGRSTVKAREYAAAGVPWLASPVGRYRELGEQHGGRLVADGEWLDALEQMIGARRERAKLAKRARSWAQRETIWNAAELWERAFLDALAGARRSGVR